MANRSIARKARPDLSALLARFNDARAILECGVLLLEEWDGSRLEPADEAICLRHGLELLGAVYDELDRAIPELRSSNR